VHRKPVRVLAPLAADSGSAGHHRYAVTHITTITITTTITIITTTTSRIVA